MELLKKLQKYSDDNNLITAKDSILVALSGGADSVTLLHLLYRLRKKKNLSISAVYVNHQLRQKAAKKEERFCQELCDSLNIELHLVSVNIKSLAEKNKKGIEETARNFRYELFETLAQEYNYTKIAIGHHQNDQIETILFRIFRGTGLTGLKGIPTKRDMIIRPMLSISKDEILSYTVSHKLNYCEDKTNRQSHFKRNYIRNKLIPLLKTNLNQSVEKAILNLSATVSDEEEYLKTVVEKKIKKIISYSVGGKILLQKNLYLGCDSWIRRRILRLCLLQLSATNVFPDKATVDRLDNAIKLGKKALSIPQKLEMSLLDEQILLYPRLKIKFNLKFDVGDSCHLKKLNYIVSAKKRKKIYQSLKDNKKGMIGRFDLAKIEQPICIRSIKDGDRFSPFGMKGTKKIGDYLTDKKVNRLFRDETVVLADKNGILWIVGHQIDERTKIDKNTTEVLEIECKRKYK